MGRKKKSEEPDLLSQDLRAVAGLAEDNRRHDKYVASQVGTNPGENGAPIVLEYTPIASTEEWRVEKFEDFMLEFEMNAATASFQLQLSWFHELGRQHARAWLICRRLYGIGPMIPPVDSHPDDLRPNSRKELCASLGLAADELQAELDAMRVIWREHLRAEQKVEVKEPTALEQKPKEELEFGDEILDEFGFDEKMFELVVVNPITKKEEARPDKANRLEKHWFCKRLQEWRRMLSEPMCGALARKALINELRLRRFEQEISRISPGAIGWKQIYDYEKQTAEEFKDQISQLQEMFPEAHTQGKEGFRYTISGIIQARREYYSAKGRELADKLFTAAEIEVLMRQTVQSPEPRYRFGWNMAIVEAMHGLNDPNWRPQFKPSVLKKMDAGFKSAVEEMRQALSEPLVDLEKGVLPGEGDDFPDLKQPEEAQEPPHENEI